MPHGHQPNTYDTSVSGANTFIGSQYLAALAAAERMALAMGDPESARRWQTVREAGMKNQDEKLWNGEYYIQIPEPHAANDYDTGCHADQLLGQWWAHMLDLGYLYPAKRVKSALAAIMKYNFREQFAGFKQAPRRYIPDDDGGLIICTWPHGGRPQPFILYADEVWTGIEYAAAGAMLYEGFVDSARRIVQTARRRYDGKRREGLELGSRRQPVQRAGMRQVLRPGHELLVALDRFAGAGAGRSQGDPGVPAELAAGGPPQLLHRAGGLGTVRAAAQAGAADRADRGPPRPVAAQGARVRHARPRGGDGHRNAGRPGRGRHAAADRQRMCGWRSTKRSWSRKGRRSRLC